MSRAWWQRWWSWAAATTFRGSRRRTGLIRAMIGGGCHQSIHGVVVIAAWGLLVATVAGAGGHDGWYICGLGRAGRKESWLCGGRVPSWFARWGGCFFLDL
jgi:hypothetical protein